MAQSRMQGRLPFTYHFIFTFILFFNATIYSQQNLCFESANTFNSEIKGAAYRSVVDDEENVYTLGSFKETVVFGSGEQQTVLISNGNNDTYLSKYDREGTFLWVRQFGGAQSDEIRHLGINNQADLFISGSFQGTMDFDPGAGVDEYISGAQRDFFLIKLNREGVYQWSRKMEGNNESHPSDLKITHDGSILLSATFQGIQDVDFGQGENLLNEADGGTVVLKLDPQGDFVWVNQWNVDETTTTIDSNNDILISGKFYTTVDFDNGPDIIELTPSGIQPDVFVLKLSANGDFIWVKQITGGATKNINEITTDIDNNVIYTGLFVGATDFDPGPDTHIINSSNGADAFLSKLDSDGNHLFTKDLGVVTSCIGEHVATDVNGKIYMTGFYNSTMDFNPNSGEFIMTNTDFGNHFLVKLDADGGFVYAKQLEGDLPVTGNDLIVTEDKKVIISGGYNGTVDFDPGEDTFLHTTPSGNSFVVTWYQEYHEAFTDILCDTYTSPSGTQEWNSSGIHIDTLVTEDGCMTIYEITLYEMDTSVELSTDENSLIAQQEDAKYQWINCDSNETIEGETNQQFTPNQSGNYAVEILFEGCTQLSECVSFEYVDIVSNVTELENKSFSVYPNPTNGDITLQFPEKQENAVINVYNSIGKMVMSTSIAQTDRFSLSIEDNPGVYFLEINGNYFLRQRIIKL